MPLSDVYLDAPPDWLQIRALDKMTVERVSAERTECLHRIDQRAMEERLEVDKRQVMLATREQWKRGWRWRTDR